MSGVDLVERAARAGLRAPAALTVAITGRCNLRCRHCWVEAGRRGSAGHAPVGGVLRLVDGLAALGGDAIWITGGEPLSHPEWASILSACCARPSIRTVGLQTNGALLDAAAVARLRALPAAKLHVQLSLDGASPRTHDRVRGPGSFAEAVAGASRLSAAGLGGRTAIAFTEMRHNMGDVPELLGLCEDLRLRGVVAGTLVKDGGAARSALEPPTPAQYRELLARFHGDAGFRERCERLGRFTAIEWWKGRSSARGEPCAFLQHPYVSARGAMYPCRLCHAEAFAVAGAFEKPFQVALGEAIARARTLVRLARARSSSPACRGCAARIPCAGGCMGRALATRGTLTAAEDRCDLRRTVHRWQAADAPSLLPPPCTTSGDGAGPNPP